MNVVNDNDCSWVNDLVQEIILFDLYLNVI